MFLYFLVFLNATLKIRPSNSKRESLISYLKMQLNIFCGTQKLNIKIESLLLVLFSLFDSNSGSSMLDWRESQPENSRGSILIIVELKSNRVVHEASSKSTKRNQKFSSSTQKLQIFENGYGNTFHVCK